jgi:SAM-dependent methyltransferase
MGNLTLKLHLERYRFAARFVNPGRCIDIACGVGYGSQLLARSATGIEEVIGVDISKEAVDFAAQHYPHERLRFVQHDAITFRSRDRFDSVVSLETIEHVSNPSALVDNLIGLVRQGGILVASVPTTPSVDVNPHHLTDFTETSFRRLFQRYSLREIATLRQTQPYRPISTLRRTEVRMQNLRKGLFRYYCQHPVACLRRGWATLRWGFSTRYLTVVWKKCETGS